MLQVVQSDLGLLARSRASLFISTLAAVVALRYVWDRLPGMRKRNMPPGPRTYPIVGNIFNLKAELSALHAEYGDIISFKIGNTTTISLAGDGTLVHELLDKRGAIYSNRPYNPLLSTATKGDHQLFQTDTDKWRIGRKQMMQHFAANVMTKPERFVIQEAESVQLLHECSQNPDNLAAYVMRYTTSVITCLTYGVRCETIKDPAVHVEDIMRYGISIKMPGLPVLPGLPFLNGIPGFLSPWRAKARKLGQMMDSLYGGLLGVGQQRGVEGLNTETLAYKLLAGEGHTGISRHHQAYICGIVLEGGSDIVAAVVMACLLALIHDPESQTRARTEIDSIYDRETLPSWRNQRSLPFVRAVIKETLRWRPPMPVSIPHRLEKDDYYGEYFLPKDSIVLCNSWAIHMNPKRFAESEKFKPERYLGYDASMQEYVSQGDPLKRDHFTFGAGRRVCPGIQTAEQSIFIALSRLLWAFEFSAPPGTTPSVDRNTAFHTSGVRSPLPFPVVVAGRSEERFKAIGRELASAKEIYARYVCPVSPPTEFMPRAEDTQFSLAALFVLAALATVIALGYASDWPGIRKSHMPPGPPAWPIVGNFLSLKRTGRFQQLQELHAHYGDIISLKLGSSTLISTAGDGTHIHELLDKRGSIYSNRPVNILTAYATQDDNFLFKQDKEIWRIGRKQIIQQFGPNAMIRSERFMLQEAESVQLLYDCLRTPDKLFEHSIRYTASVVTCLTYGVRCESFQDPAVHGVEHLLQFGGGIYVPGGKPPIVAFPWMNYLPEFAFPWRKKARRYGQMMGSLYGGKSPLTHLGNTHRFAGLYESGRQRGDEGLNPECFAYKVWTDAKRTGLTKRQQVYLCGVVLEGGSDIVSMIISTCILGLIHSLESQARARAEIDGIYDQGNLPSWRDEQSLPFVRAGLAPFPNQVPYIIDNTGWMTVIKEAMRWRPPLPIAVAHRLEQDDYYNGLFFPKNSIVLCNAWSIHMNPGRFNEPDKFKPERYLNYESSMQEYVSRGDPLKRDHFSFGAGRRVCPGIQTAEQSIFIAISRLLWAFEFSAPPGCRVDVDQKTAFRGEGIRGPVPFPVVIKPRSEARVRTIEREMSNAKEVYAQYGVYKVPLSDL